MASLAKLSDESEKLYTALLAAAHESEEGLKKVFFQPDLQSFAGESGRDVKELMPLVQELINHSLLRVSRLGGALCYSTRPRDAAKAITMLNGDEKLIYSHVEEAHSKGVWQRDIKKRTNINQTIVQKAMTKLENQRLIKSVRSVKNPAQKTYMLFHLVPSDDVTGGSFFDGGDLDESLIRELSNLIIFHVRMQSWSDTKPKKVKRALSPVIIDNGSTNGVPISPNSKKKRKRPATDDIEDAPRKHRRHDEDEVVEVVTQLAYPAYTRSYPSAEGIHQFITTTDAIRASKAEQLTVAEIQQVVDTLVWDDRLEKVGNGYRTVRGISFKPVDYGGSEQDSGDEGKGNGLTQAPCGSCPVLDLCSDDGPINAGSCTYWAKWIAGG
ncbi:hypothetical protein B0A50_08301 [Salinomyces thailandicus]|uniref:DNA-directed RNA polymerase III subunit RPC6 n=1 Tax=Salinomyces thailandicus TaxID=706561 RepID=A0A4U0TLK5_9PEZI|nr:hypothetical protein B0A50_08301 [Salinomyces thailandica]